MSADSPKGGFELKHGGKTGAQETQWPPSAQDRSSQMLSFCCLKGFLAMIFVVSSPKVILRALKCCSNRLKTPP